MFAFHDYACCFSGKSGQADLIAILRDHAPFGYHKIIIHLLLMICDYAGQADFIAILRDHATGGCSRGHKLPFMIMLFFFSEIGGSRFCRYFV